MAKQSTTKEKNKIELQAEAQHREGKRLFGIASRQEKVLQEEKQKHLYGKATY